jgi:hypothetical protein
MATFKEVVRSLTKFSLSSSGTNSQDAVDAIDIVPVANAAAADKLTVTNASMGQATTVTIPDPGVAAATMVLAPLAGYGPVSSVAAITAGTTQTQAGATAITTDVAYVTTGNASDGVRLPLISKVGQRIQIINASANAGVVYGTGTTSTNTIDGTAGATGVAYAASKTLFLIAVSSTAWVSTLSN